MKNEWNIGVNWKASNAEYVKLILRDPAEAYQKAHHVTWIVSKSRFVRDRASGNNLYRFAAVEELVRTVANEVALGKRLLAERGMTAN